MSIGYNPDRFVWAIDRKAKIAGPVKRTAIKALADRYAVDEDHPVVDRDGRLLPSKPVEDVATPSTATAAATPSTAGKATNKGDDK